MRRNPWAGPMQDIGTLTFAVLDQRPAACFANTDLRFGFLAGIATCCNHCSCEQPPGKEESEAYAKVARAEGLFALIIALQDSEPVRALTTEDYF